MAEHKKILLISYCFAPQNVIGAVRPTKFAKYLTRLGHEVTVICGVGKTDLKDPTLESDLQELQNVRMVREWNPLRDMSRRKKRGEAVAQKAGVQAERKKDEARGSSGFLHRVIDQAYILLAFLADRSFARRGKQAVRRMNTRYDVVLSSYGPLSVHEIGAYTKRKGMAKRWIADFRDEITVPFPWLRGYASRCLSGVKREADQITAVSGGVLAMMGLAQRGIVIPNGFDGEDLRSISEKAIQQDALMTFVYCGQLFAGQKLSRTLEPFFHSIRRLSEQGVCERKECRVLYVGKEGAALKQQAAAAGVEEIVYDIGPVNRAHALALQKSADVLLLASWNSREQQGILTGKMLEYLMMNKPIVCCMKGDMPQSETKSILQAARIGFCYEEANAAADEQQLDRYVENLIVAAREIRPLMEQPDTAYLKQFAYPAIVERLEQWL